MHALISGPIAGDSTLSGTALSALLHSGEGLEGSARRYLIVVFLILLMRHIPIVASLRIMFFNNSAQAV